MTGIDLPRWSHGGFSVKLHTSATDLLLASYTTLSQREISASIILAHALDRLQNESERLCTLRKGGNRAAIEIMQGKATERPAARRNFWLTVWPYSSATREVSEPILVLSCLEGYLGDYPIFLWSSDHAGTTAEDELRNRLWVIQSALLDIVRPQRVFSVFGRRDLVTAFKRTWVTRTRIVAEPEPFYEALLTYCTKDTFRPPQGLWLAKERVRVAEPSDLTSVAKLCREFADTSIYFPLTPEKAEQEAQWLIERKVIWVYEAEGNVVSICAASRQSDGVAVVTKVYTTPVWRRRGFAEALVRTVTENLLETKQHVALYVGIHNDAQRIYDRVGYVGLCGKARPTEVEDVLEVGFRDTRRGHW